MSAIYKHPNGAKIHQCGAIEIPFKLAKHRAIDLVVLSAKEYQPAARGPKKLMQTDKVYVPMEDRLDFSQEELEKTVERAIKASNRVVERILAGSDVLVTCWAGWNRSGLISGISIKRLSGMDGSDIVRQIRQLRSRSALSNPLFARVVEII